MKTNPRARKVRKARVRAGLLAVLVLASAEFWMVCRFGQECGQITSPSGNEAPGLSDLVAAR
jgi:hypothetical protein